MESIHVLVSGAPGLMRDIVARAVASQPDMTLLDTVGDVAQSTMLDYPRPDVVVFVLHDSDSAAADAALRRAFPTRAVVAVDTRGVLAWSYDYELRRAATLDQELTPAAVVDAIRESAARTAGRGMGSPGCESSP